MIVTKTEKKLIDVTVENYSLCDKCNEEIIVHGYDAFECELKYKIGTSYPDGGNSEDKEMELCQKCAINLFQLLKENNYRITEKETSW